MLTKSKICSSIDLMVWNIKKWEITSKIKINDFWSRIVCSCDQIHLDWRIQHAHQINLDLCSQHSLVIITDYIHPHVVGWLVCHISTRCIWLNSYQWNDRSSVLPLSHHQPYIWPWFGDILQTSNVCTWIVHIVVVFLYQSYWIIQLSIPTYQRHFTPQVMDGNGPPQELYTQCCLFGTCNYYFV